MSLEQMVSDLGKKTRLAIGRAILRAVDPALRMQALQVELLAGETRENVEHFQDYGFTCHPHPGAEGVALAVGGSRDHVVVVAMSNRQFRLRELAQGEVALYTDEGDKIVLKRGNNIEVHAATEVKLMAPLTTITGALHVMGNQTNDGRIDAAGDVTAIGTSGHSHIHMEQGDGLPVSPPL